MAARYCGRAVAFDDEKIPEKKNRMKNITPLLYIIDDVFAF